MHDFFGTGVIEELRVCLKELKYPEDLLDIKARDGYEGVTGALVFWWGKDSAFQSGTRDAKTSNLNVGERVDAGMENMIAFLEE